MLFQTSRRQVQWAAVLEFVVCSNYDGHITCVTYRCLILGDTFVYILIMYNCCGVHVSTWLFQYYDTQTKKTIWWLTIHAMLQFNLYPSIIQRFIFYFPKGFYIKTALWLPPSLHYKSTKQKQNFEGTIQWLFMFFLGSTLHRWCNG